MPTYIVLYRLTGQGLKNIKDIARRRDCAPGLSMLLHRARIDHELLQVRS